MKKSMKKKSEKGISVKIEEVEAHIAFAEAGELYPHRRQKSKKKKGAGKEHVCVDGETSSGLCTD